MSIQDEKQIRYWLSMVLSAEQIDQAGPNPFSKRTVRGLLTDRREFLAFCISDAGKMVQRMAPGDEVSAVMDDVYRGFGIVRQWVYGGEVGRQYPAFVENPTPKELENLRKRGAK